MTLFADSPYYRWFVLVIIMLGTFMAILDTNIVNVALPHMMSSFGVDREKIEWVATAFMLASAVTMPLVGWLVGRVGHKKLYAASLFLFTVSSAACALAWSYHSLIFARVLQAVGGGAIQPIGMAIIGDLFEPQERGRALGIWGTGIMLGPTIGPVAGGYLTEWFNWRSIFSVNIPVGILTLSLILLIMKKEKPGSGRDVPLDILGFMFLSVALITGLLAMSYGQDKGWTSNYILTCLILSVASFICFVTTESVVKHPLLDLGLFRHRNYSLSMALAVFRSLGLFGAVFLLPLFLIDVVGYTTVQTGLWMMPGAVAVGVSMPIAGRLADRRSPRALVFFGTVVTAFGMFLFGNLDPLSSKSWIIGPQIVRGVGLAFMMTPLLTAALNSVPRESIATASSFLNIIQRVGGAFGIALTNSIVTKMAQVHMVRQGELITVQSCAFQNALLPLSQVELHKSVGVIPTETVKASFLLIEVIRKRATVLAFDNGFMFIGGVLLLGLFLVVFLKPEKFHG
jgi:DHA2 family multidrug resistance protein